MNTRDPFRGDSAPRETHAASPAEDSALEQRSRELFDQHVSNLDARTRSRLNQARQAALAAHKGGAGGAFGARWLLPVGSAAALALVALTTTQFLRPVTELPQAEVTALAAATTGSVDDLEIIASGDELDMLQDMDFYAWLETQQDVLAASGETG